MVTFMAGNHHGSIWNSDYTECLEQKKGSFLKNYRIDGTRRLKMGFMFMVAFFISLLFIATPLIIFVFFFGIMVIYNVITGLIFISIHDKQRKEFEYLTSKGTLVLAEGKKALNYGYKMALLDDFDPLHIEAKYTDDGGQDYVFKSPPLWIYPIPYLDQKKVKVYYESNNMKRYVMDIDDSVNPDIRIPSEYFQKTKKK